MGGGEAAGSSNTLVGAGGGSHHLGTDILPDILLPEDQYLDMFDSDSDISGDNSEDELVEVPL